MKFCTIIVTRSKSCAVKTLHTILKFNVHCIRNGAENEIIFVNDDSIDKSKAIEDNITRCDRIFFIDFGIGVDEDSLEQLFKPHENIGFLVFPGVKDGVDWDMFKTKIKNEVDEPVEQMGLNFDTSVGKKISNDIYHVKTTDAKCWFMNCKNVLNGISDKRGKFTINTKYFKQAIEKNVKIYAFTAAKLVITYTHECISSILNAAGVKTG
jgi:hypothetical protein|tara:strand:+ start:2272 stop:2901 length:630 start_codon:yes stop_codon:yes gene_type:complete